MSEKTVLIVEDDEMTAALLEVIVKEAGFEPLIAIDGVSAIEQYQTHQPAIILLDIHLPLVNGYSIATLIRDFSNHQPRIFVVTSSPEDYEEHLKNLTNGCVTKPINRQKLLELLQG